MTSRQKSVGFMPLTLQIQHFTKAVCLVIFSIDVLGKLLLLFYRNMLVPVMDMTRQFKWLDYINLFKKKKLLKHSPTCLSAFAINSSNCLPSLFCSLFK